MDSAKLGLLTTLLLGVFIIIGALVAFLIKRKERVVDFSLGLAFGVIVMLILTHMLPETIELLGLKYIFIFLIFTILGYMILRLLDNFIPDHDDDGKGMDKEELKENLIHIGVITSIALVLHNVIEGMAVYSTVLSDASLGLAVTLGIGFHNIPLGMVIAGTFYQSNENIYKSILSILFVSLSTFAGGLIMFFLGLSSISPIISGILLSVLFSIVIYILSKVYFRLIKGWRWSYLWKDLKSFYICLFHILY